MGESGFTPHALNGAWTRRSLAVGGGAPLEDSDVIWLQLGDLFADLRTPRRAQGMSRCAAFSGRTCWMAPEIVFHRDLDLDAAAIDDRARLDLKDDLLIERGEVQVGGRPVAYEETWVRPGGPARAGRVLDGKTTGERATSMRLVQVDDIAIVLLDERRQGRGFGAAEFRREGAHWRPVRAVGRPQVPGPPEAWRQASLVSGLIPETSSRAWTSRSWRLREQLGGLGA
ncbi:MAG: hypothetical protein JF588_20670 [Caulobacterales bacterium]|nr:hypothetical protein [Caulobacterales bacterium]